MGNSSSNRSAFRSSIPCGASLQQSELSASGLGTFELDTHGSMSSTNSDVVVDAEEEEMVDEGLPPLTTAELLAPFANLGLALRGHFLDAKDLAAISWEELLTYVSALNESCRTHVDPRGKYLLFALKKGTSDTFMWKATIKICCLKVNAATGRIESRKLLSLSQFLKLQRSLQAMVLNQQETESGGGASSSTPTTDALPPMTASVLIDNIGGSDVSISPSEKSNNDGELNRECTICLERKPEVILPCAHSYCVPCIEQKEGGHRWCPICRTSITKSNDEWVISERPDDHELTSYLISLTEDRKK